MQKLRKIIAELSPLDFVFLTLFALIAYGVGQSLLNRGKYEPMTSAEITQSLGSISDAQLRNRVRSNLRSQLHQFGRISKFDFDSTLAAEQREQEDRQSRRTVADQANALNGAK